MIKCNFNHIGRILSYSLICMVQPVLGGGDIIYSSSEATLGHSYCQSLSENSLSYFCSTSKLSCLCSTSKQLDKVFLPLSILGPLR